MDEISQKDKDEKPDSKKIADQVFLFYRFMYNKKDVEIEDERLLDSNYFDPQRS